MDSIVIPKRFSFSPFDFKLSTSLAIKCVQLDDTDDNNLPPLFSI